jgi:hypothetical protein
MGVPRDLLAIVHRGWFDGTEKGAVEMGRSGADLDGSGAMFGGPWVDPEEPMTAFVSWSM